MNYFEHHIGDYDKDTSHLTACEDGIYCRLLRRYYNTEAPLPNDLPLLERLVRAHTKDERKAVGAMLREFFKLADDGWHHVRCDKEIARYADKREKASRSANARWEQSERNANAYANALPTQCEGNAHQSPDTSIKSKHPSDALPADACPHADILALYHELLPANPRVKAWTGTRQSNLRARWREDDKRQSLDYWRRLFVHIGASAFLTGKRTGQDGRAFLPGLDWIVKPENFAKIIEGRYHERG